jgi:hypothetical protein
VLDQQNDRVHRASTARRSDFPNEIVAGESLEGFHARIGQQQTRTSIVDHDVWVRDAAKRVHRAGDKEPLFAVSQSQSFDVRRQVRAQNDRSAGASLVVFLFFRVIGWGRGGRTVAADHVHRKEASFQLGDRFCLCGFAITSLLPGTCVFFVVLDQNR